MKGSHKVVIQAKRIRFTFTLRRNLTIVRGDSATGKTSLVDMVQQHMDNPSGSPYSVEEIYGIHYAGKYGQMKKVYNDLFNREAVAKE